MTTYNTVSAKNEKKKPGGLWMILFIISLIVNGVLGFLYFSTTATVKEKDEIIVTKTEENEELTASRDSLVNELKIKYDEIAALGGDTAALGEKIRELETKNKSLASSAYSAQRARKALLSDIEEIKVILKDKDDEIVRLKQLTENQQQEITGLKNTLNEKDSNLSLLNSAKEELAQQVKIASILKAENIKVTVLTSKNKEKESEKGYKSKDIDRLQVRFNFGENKVATIQTKTVYLKITEPGGSTIFNSETGSGTFEDKDGKELPYTVKEDMLFDNKKTVNTFTFKKGNEYKSGKHNVEIYSDGYLIGTSSFTVK